MYWAGRATLVRRPEDLPLFDRAFAVFWERAEPAAADDRRRAAARSPSPSTTTTTTTTTPTDDAEASDDPTIAAALQRHRGAAPQGLRRLQRRRAGRGPPADGRLRFAGPPRRSLPHARRSRRDGAARPAPHRARVAARRRRADPPPLARARRAAAPARAAARRQRVDGALRPGAAALRPRRGRRPAAGRGVRPRHPADPDHPRARQPRPRHGAAPGRRARSPTGSGGTRLGDGPAPVQRRVGRARHGPRRDRRDPLRRLGPRRPRGAGRADAAAAARRPPRGLGQPAEGHARATRRWPGAWRPRCRTSTTSSRATRWPPWTSWPT